MAERHALLLCQTPQPFWSGMLCNKHATLPDFLASNLAEGFGALSTADAATIDWDDFALVLLWVAQNLCSTQTLS